MRVIVVAIKIETEITMPKHYNKVSEQKTEIVVISVVSYIVVDIDKELITLLQN